MAAGAIFINSLTIDDFSIATFSLSQYIAVLYMKGSGIHSMHDFSPWQLFLTTSYPWYQDYWRGLKRECRPSSTGACKLVNFVSSWLSHPWSSQHSCTGVNRIIKNMHESLPHRQTWGAAIPITTRETRANLVSRTYNWTIFDRRMAWSSIWPTQMILVCKGEKV